MSEATGQARRAILPLLAALALLASGCLTAPTEETSAPEPETTEPQGSANASEAPEEGSEERHERDDGSENATGSSPDANSTSEDDPPEPRTIEHAAGETTIEGTPERVVALEFNHVENVLALGIQPAGVADKDGFQTWVDVGIELDESVTDVGTRAEPSLETIADLEPDLILAIEFRHREIYDDLSAIAPTLLFEGFPSEDGVDQYERMLSIFDRTAAATATTDRGRDVVDGMRDHFQRIRSDLEEANLTGREVLLSQLFTYNGQPLARVFLDDSIAANVAERIGLENAWTKTACSTGYGYCDVSKEGFADVQHADFFYQAQPDDDPVRDAWSDDPVWNSYEFVREDRVYPLGAKAWLFGGPLMSQEIADRMVQHY